eukprot:TRINITY_DN503_c0_g1_i11.p1 TRINITY_DN503_c0_g1~~TRINITY_DN503_c0_g1_i11.p1  ORF type:complete len:119 (-),score=18.85 TRINITY_DN503_c0_g1_i11:828-1184(-)
MPIRRKYAFLATVPTALLASLNVCLFAKLQKDSPFLPESHTEKHTQRETQRERERERERGDRLLLKFGRSRFCQDLATFPLLLRHRSVRRQVGDGQPAAVPFSFLADDLQGGLFLVRP